MGSVWKGEALTLSIFGESHGAGVGLVLDGFPAGHRIDWDELRTQQARRASKGAAHETKRREPDLFDALSGLLDDVTTGAPIAAMTRNTDTRSGDYQNLTGHPRPGHADYTGSVRYNGFNDPRGGGHFSGRLTAAWVFAGMLCRQWLASQGITVGAHIAQVADIRDDAFPPTVCDPAVILAPGRASFPVIDRLKGEVMRARIEAARMDADSVGGVVECAILGLPAGLGNPIFDNVESRLSSLLFAVPAVRGVEFGGGFGLCAMRGSAANDPFILDGTHVATAKNNHGGALGGITTGMPVLFRVGFKPTASISIPQKTLNLQTEQQDTLVIKGRHDPCIVPRAVPVVEAAAALAAADLILEARGYAGH